MLPPCVDLSECPRKRQMTSMQKKFIGDLGKLPKDVKVCCCKEDLCNNGDMKALKQKIHLKPRLDLKSSNMTTPRSKSTASEG